jgi:hypothetical protein
MKKFLEFWQTDFYTVAISFLLAVIGLIISLRRRQNHKLRPLIFFFLGYVLLEVLQSVNRAMQLYRPLRVQISIYLDFADTIIEFFSLYLVIRNFVINARIIKILKTLPFVFAVSMAFYFFYYKITYEKLDQYFLQTIFTIQACLLIVASSCYYIDIFTKVPKSKLSDDPSFWVVTGVAFFMLCTLPFSILGLYLIKTNLHLYLQLFIIFEIFYWILFLMIIKAYFCNPVMAD